MRCDRNTDGKRARCGSARDHRQYGCPIVIIGEAVERTGTRLERQRDMTCGHAVGETVGKGEATGHGSGTLSGRRGIGTRQVGLIGRACARRHERRQREARRSRRRAAASRSRRCRSENGEPSSRPNALRDGGEAGAAMARTRRAGCTAAEGGGEARSLQRPWTAPARSAATPAFERALGLAMRGPTGGRTGLRSGCPS